MGRLDLDLDAFLTALAVAVSVTAVAVAFIVLVAAPPLVNLACVGAVCERTAVCSERGSEGGANSEPRPGESPFEFWCVSSKLKLEGQKHQGAYQGAYQGVCFKPVTAAHDTRNF